MQSLTFYSIYAKIFIVKKESQSPRHENAPAYEYKVLKGHQRTDGSYKSDEMLKMEYIHRTDTLIHIMTHGANYHDGVNGEIVTRKPDNVIFLDKSARPLAWLVRELWNKLAIDDNGQIAEMPDMNFLNIDRNQWVNTVDHQGNGTLDVDRVDDSVIRSLRSIFVSPMHKSTGITDEIDNVPASLDEKYILVVDEVFSTGRTMNIAEKMLERAFPSAHIAGFHWMSEVATKGQAVGNADLPIWYKKDSPLGRGVNDRMKNPSGQESANITQKLGAWFLSTRFNKPDELSMMLRDDMKQLANDDSIPIRLSYDRYDLSDDAEYEKFIAHTERVNRVSHDKVQHRVKEILPPHKK